MIRYRASRMGDGSGKSITYGGLDVQKDMIEAALADAGLRGEVREHGNISDTPVALKALGVMLAATGRELRFCYEAKTERAWGSTTRQRHGA